jgi:hypothetical protein
VEIEAHYVPACRPSAESAPALLELIALGDFDRDNDSVVILDSDASSRGLELPPGTRAAQLESLGDGAYWGSGTLDAQNRLPIVLWPRNRACALARVDGLSPGDAGEWLLGGSDRLQTLLAIGPLGAGSSLEALRVDLADAASAPLSRELIPRVARERGALSELGDSLLLSGGIDVQSGRLTASAERYDPSLGRFSSESIALAGPRARHAAISLPSGSSLLIGGESEPGRALGSVEVLGAESPRVPRVFELLATPRIAPRAVLLGQTRILVGGGYVLGPDQLKQPIATVEFLSSDFTDVAERPISLEPAALDRAFVALAAGAALAVGGCVPQADSVECVPCEGGCVSRDVWWIDPRGEPRVIEPLSAELAVAAPRLVPGAGGRPWLLAGGHLGRFDPWLGRFERIDLGRAPPSALLGEPMAIRPGLFAWLEADADGVELVGFHHSQRGPYAQDVAPLLIGSAEGLVPHQPPGVGADTGQLTYAAATGLELAGAAAVVSVADSEYAAFTLELRLAAGPAPLLRLVAARGGDDDAAFGGLECPWPDLSGGSADPLGVIRLRVQRSLDQVRLERLEQGAAVEPRPEPCRRSLPERVSIQLVGTPGGTSRIERIEIRRSVD